LVPYRLVQIIKYLKFEEIRPNYCIKKLNSDPMVTGTDSKAGLIL
jgi:hypothetical protein